jgi:hypothetical protein
MGRFPPALHPNLMKRQQARRLLLARVTWMELEDEMAVSSGHITALVTKIQNDFLDTPSLTLTLPQAQKRFSVDEITCEAVLGTLVDAGVLARTSDDAYVRFFPRVSVSPREAHVSGHPERAKTAAARGHSIADFAA